MDITPVILVPGSDDGTFEDAYIAYPQHVRTAEAVDLINETVKVLTDDLGAGEVSAEDVVEALGDGYTLVFVTAVSSPLPLYEEERYEY